MAKAKKLLVPVSLRRGGILHDTDYCRGAADRADAARIDAEQMEKNGHTRWGAEYVWEEVAPFTTRLRVVSTGHKNSHVLLVDAEGRSWPMFTTDYVALMSTANVVDGWIAPTEYETCKKGARAYGIRAKVA